MLSQAAVSVFPHEIYKAPRSWAERAYPNLVYFNEVDWAITSLPGRNRRCLPPRSAPRSGHCASGAPRSFTARLTARSGCCHSPRMGLGERVRYQTSFTDSARWDGFVFRPGDIVISTPAKCGTTWLQMLCALLIFDGPAFPAPLGHLSPWLDMCNRPLDEMTAALAAQTHRR